MAVSAHPLQPLALDSGCREVPPPCAVASL